MLMFRSKRSKLLDKLWKHKLDDCYCDENYCKNGNIDNKSADNLSSSYLYSNTNHNHYFNLLNNHNNHNSETITTSNKLNKRINDQLSKSLSTLSEDFIESITKLLLNRLTDKQLDDLFYIIKHKGSEISQCILIDNFNLSSIPSTSDKEKATFASTSKSYEFKILPNVLSCKLWRWPNLNEDNVLLKTCTLNCKSNYNYSSICINPYHWSLVKKTEKDSTMDIYLLSSTLPSQTNKTSEKLINLKNKNDLDNWAEIIYWEHRNRVGRKFPVSQQSIDIFSDLPHGNGFCLKTINAINNTSIINIEQQTDNEHSMKVKDLIGYGITLTNERDGVWIYNRSNYPIFVNSLTLDLPESEKITVYKLLPGYSLKAFDYDKADLYKDIIDRRQKLNGPYCPYSIRLSFVKGWGPNYSRMCLFNCPCWLEIFLISR